MIHMNTNNSDKNKFKVAPMSCVQDNPLDMRRLLEWEVFRDVQEMEERVR